MHSFETILSGHKWNDQRELVSPHLYLFHDESKLGLNFWLLLPTILNNIVGKVEQGQFVPALCSHKVPVPENETVKTGHPSLLPGTDSCPVVLLVVHDPQRHSLTMI